MKIDKEKLGIGIWYSDSDMHQLPNRDGDIPEGAVYAHSRFPLEVRERIYRIGKDGHRSGPVESCVHLSRDNGRLLVAMVNSGDYDLYEAMAILASCCERCANVLWDKYVPGEGYPEYSEKWHKANTCCAFCTDEEEKVLVK